MTIKELYRRRVAKMRNYCKQITKHGQETMMFKCDQCGHEVAIDAYDMFVAEFNVFCPVCSASPEHLNYKEFEND